MAIKHPAPHRPSPDAGSPAIRRTVGRIQPFKTLYAGIIIAVTFVCYAPVLRCHFIWDDDTYVLNNLALRDLSGLGRIWLDPSTTPQYYPAVHTTFWIEYHLWGFAPLGFHIVNVALHALAALLLWRVLENLEIPGALAASVLFAVHPVNVESVAWVTERKNVLSAVFYLASLLLFLRSSTIGAASNSAGLRLRPVPYALSFAMFVLALFSKTITCSLPVAILLVIWWKRGCIKWRRDVLPLMPFFLVGAVMGLLTAWLERQQVGAVGDDWALSMVDRLLLAGRAVWFYTGKLLWPHPLIFIYPRWSVSSHVWWQWLFPAALLAVLIGLFSLRRRLGRGPLAAALFYIATLFPALGFFNVYPFRYSFVADHFQYLASMGLLAALCAGVVLAARRGQVPRWLITAFASVAVGILVVVCWRTLPAYRDEIALWRDVLRKNPSAWIAHNNLAIALDEQSPSDEALWHHQRALQLRPDWESHHNLGSALGRRQRFDEAIPLLRKALEMEPGQPDVARALAAALAGSAAEAAQRGQVEEAVRQCDEALRLNPQRVDALNNLAWLLATHPRWQQRKAEAVPLAQRAVELLPGQPEPTESSSPRHLDRPASPKVELYDLLDTLAAAYASAGQFARAQTTADRAVKLAEAADNHVTAAAIRERLRLYQQNRPFVEGP